MAHQLDFKVTLWSDDSDTLLELERRLQELHDKNVNVGGCNVTQNLHSFASIIRGLAYGAAIAKVDVHSIDINWDEPQEDEEPEPCQNVNCKTHNWLIFQEYENRYAVLCTRCQTMGPRAGDKPAAARAWNRLQHQP